MERLRLGFMKKEQKPLTPQKITEKKKSFKQNIKIYNTQPPDDIQKIYARK